VLGKIAEIQEVSSGNLWPKILSPSVVGGVASNLGGPSVHLENVFILSANVLPFLFLMSFTRFTFFQAFKNFHCEKSLFRPW
jgi:hypothetical protein